MRYPLQVLRFTEETGIAGAILYLTDDVELTDLHIRSAVEARSLMTEGVYAEPHLEWWDASKYW